MGGGGGYLLAIENFSRAILRSGKKFHGLLTVDSRPPPDPPPLIIYDWSLRSTAVKVSGHRTLRLYIVLM